MATAKAKYTYLKEIRITYKLRRVKNRVEGRQIKDALTVVELFADLQNETKEKMIVLNMDAANKILCYEVVAIGSLNAVYVRPQECFRTTFTVNAYSAIVIHNHPSGEVKPSEDDYLFTQKLMRMSQDMGLHFLDHIIIGFDKEYYSFAEEGKLILDAGGSRARKKTSRA